jgi:hypothetical protein
VPRACSAVAQSGADARVDTRRAVGQLRAGVARTSASRLAALDGPLGVAVLALAGVALADGILYAEPLAHVVRLSSRPDAFQVKQPGHAGQKTA